MSGSDKDLSIESLLSLKAGLLWSAFKAEGFAFWMICCYLFFEYVRPQSLITGLDFIPWSQIFIILSAASWLLSNNREERVPSSLSIWMIAFLGAILLSSSFAFNSNIAFSKIDLFYNWLIIFFLIRFIVTNEQRLLIFLIIFFLASLKLSVFGARTWVMRGFSFTSWGMRGPPGFFTNSGELAVQMSVFFGMSYYFYQIVKTRIKGWLLWVVMSAPVTAAMTIMAASSRGAQLALLVQVYFIFLHGKVSIKAIFSVVIVVGLLFYALPDEQMERFNSVGEDKTSQQRLLYWENGWDMMLENPVFGVGFFNFTEYYSTFYSADMLYDFAELAHNIFIQVGADLGFLGLGIYLIMIWQGFMLPIKVGRRLVEQGKEDDWRILMGKGLAVGFLGFVVAGQFVSIVYYPYMWIHLAFCCALLNTTSEPRKPVASYKATKPVLD